MYKITVKTIKGNVLVFQPVKEYTVEDGFVVFVNPVKGGVKRFAVANSEIEEVGA